MKRILNYWNGRIAFLFGDDDRKETNTSIK